MGAFLFLSAIAYILNCVLYKNIPGGAIQIEVAQQIEYWTPIYLKKNSTRFPKQIKMYSLFF